MKITNRRKQKTNVLNNKINTSIDSIFLYRSFNKDFADLVRRRQKNQLDHYICKVDKESYSNTIRYSIRIKPYQKSCIILDFKPNGEYVNSYIQIHLNNFLYQRFRKKDYVDGSTIKEELEKVISHYTFFGDFNLNRMAVSQVDIATDIIIDYHPSFYKQLLYTIPFPYKLIHHSNGHDTITVHKLSDVSSIESAEDTERKATIYNKYDQLFSEHDIELDRNTLRLEYKLSGRDKNQKTSLVEGEEVGVNKFSDIFKVDLNQTIKNILFDKWLYKYDDIVLEKEISKNTYSKKSKEYLTKFSGQVSYYRKRELLDDDLAVINCKIDRLRDKWIEKQLESLSSEVKERLWLRLYKAFNDKYFDYLDTEKYGEERLLSMLEDDYNNYSLNKFMEMANEFVRLSKHKLPFNERLNKEIRSSLSVIYNSLFEDEIYELRKDVNNQRRKLNRDYNKYRFYRFLMLANQTLPNSNTKKIELYEELLTKVDSLNSTSGTSSEMMNTYKVYQDLFPNPLQWEVT